MSAYPSSTCATDGSANESLPLPAVQTLAGYNSHTTTPSSSDTQNLSAQRITAYLNNPIDSQPKYKNTTISASMATHNIDMESYLKSFENVMKK
ncbi:hypothetical protein EG329_013695 [Mollisiaceae sp. DMI_Dod_QoI]|nr:hypothetical protein EG329_013695 [Helotiales sp. DMI_Dod_QoI]